MMKMMMGRGIWGPVVDCTPADKGEDDDDEDDYDDDDEEEYDLWESVLLLPEKS